MDLFHHEMLVTALFRCFRIPLNMFFLFLDFFPVQIVKGDLAFADTGHLQISDIIHVSCVFQDSRNIGCDIGSAVLHTQDHRAVFAGYINFTWISLERDRKGIRATDTYHRMIDGIHRRSLILLVIIINQLNSYLCIRRGIEGIAFAHQFIF